jgi:lysophospholipase L1-like esterase
MLTLSKRLMPLLALLLCLGLCVSAGATTWTQVVADGFTRANGAVGNGWVSGTLSGVAAISSNQLTLTRVTSADYTLTEHVLLRPTSENAVDERVDFTTAALPDVAGTETWTAPLRVQSNSVGNFPLHSKYVFEFASNGQLQIHRVTDWFILYTGYAGTVGGSVSTTAGHQYDVSCRAVNVWPTVLTMTVADHASPGTILTTITVSDSTAVLQQAGQSGVGLNSANTIGLSASFASATTYTSTQSGALTAPTDVVAGPGAHDGSLSVASGFPTGGTPPYTVQWYKQKTNYTSFTPNGTNLISGATTQVYIDPTPNAASGTPTGSYNTYIAVWTDSVGATVYTETGFHSGLTGGHTLGFDFIGDSITYGYGSTAGNPNGAFPSYTQAGIPTIPNLNLQATGYDSSPSPVNTPFYHTTGIPGETSTQWATSGGPLNSEIASDADAMGPGNLAVHILLGTNDSKDSVATSSATYKANLQTIMTAFSGAFPGVKFVVMKLLYLQPGVYASDFSTTSLTRLQGYDAQIDSLVDNATVFTTVDPYWHFHWEIGLADGLHPNDAGHKYLGFLALDGIRRALVPAGGGTKRRLQ